MEGSGPRHTVDYRNIFHIAAQVNESVRLELGRQEDKPSHDHTIDHWWMIATEELGEMASAILHGQPDQAEEEAVQIIACLVRMIHVFRVWRVANEEDSRRVGSTG